MKVGPDGLALFRNPADLLNNFFVDVSALAFTDIQKNLVGGTVNSSEIKRLKRYEKEIDMRKDHWTQNTVGSFTQQAKIYKKELNEQLSKFSGIKLRT